MKPYFENTDRQAVLWAAAQQWKDTPYFANNASRGHGVGCVELMHELWVAAAAIARLELPSYSIDYGHHSTRTQLIRFLLEHPALAGRLLFVPVQGRWMAGDLVGLRSGRVDHHLAMALPWSQVVHAVEDHGVVIHEHDEPKFQARVLYVLRLMES